LTRARTSRSVARMFRGFAIAARASYLLAVLLTLALLLLAIERFVTVQSQPRAFARDALADYLLAAVVLLVFGLPALRALARLFHHRDLLPEAHLRSMPVVATLVVLASALGTALILLVAWILITTLPESRDVNLAAPCALAAMLYAFALLCGEIVLVGRYPSAA